jgi:uncharacterized protein (TIGR02147 family)
MNDLFSYFDYRKLLLDFLADKHKARPSVSSHSLALKTGIDPSYFAKVLKGLRNLRPEQSLKIADALRFDKSQKEFFEVLVRFNQARGHDAKRLCFEKLLEYNKTPKAALLNKEQYAYYSRWYHAVIREVLHFHRRPVDCRSIARKLIPAISPEEARGAIELLENLSIIKPKPDGGYGLSDAFISAGPEIRSFAIKNFQIAMMEIAKTALENIPRDKREISALTLSLSEDGFREIQEEVARFRSRLMQIANNDTTVNGVYQINIQAFPVTQTF